MDLSKLAIESALLGLEKEEYTAVDLAEASLLAIKEKDGEVNAFLEVFDDVLDQAKEADKKRENGVTLPLLGIPVAVKDNIMGEGRKSSAGSRILEGFISPYDSTVIKKLKEAGAVIVGRTNMDEFAMGSSTENSAYGPTKNPHDTSRVSGGSSGGSAAAVALGMVLGAYGSDTGGSIRQPASLCGVVGFKPTYGKVSRSGLIALASSLDQIGPLANSVRDAELLYEAVVGEDPMDSTSIGEEEYERKKTFNKTIGIPKELLNTDAISSEVRKNFETAKKKFLDLGYKIKEISLPYMKYALPAYYVILPAEASSNLARFDGVKYGLYSEGGDSIDDYFKTRGKGFGREVRRRIILGTYVLSSGYYDAYYGSAITVKNMIRSSLSEQFKEVDLILTPTTLGPAFKIGEKVSNPMSMYLEDLFTVTANIAGIPAVSLPSGFVEVSGKSLPLGVQLMADLGREDNLFTSGKEFLGEKL